MDCRPLSKSTLQNWEKCSLYAHNNKVLGIRTPSTLPAEKGVEFHAAIDKILKGAYESEVKSEVEHDDVKDWLTLTICNRGLEEFKSATSETTIFANRALSSCEADVADFMGILDVIWTDHNIVHVLDWKTGAYEYDNIIERNWCAGLAKAAYPWAKTIVFELYYVRSNRSLKSMYAWNAKNNVLVVKDPFGDTSVKNESYDPLCSWIKNKIQLVEDSEPAPNVGPQCRKWYGSECYYLQEHCPAYANGRKITTRKVKNEES